VAKIDPDVSDGQPFQPDCALVLEGFVSPGWLRYVHLGPILVRFDSWRRVAAKQIEAEKGRLQQQTNSIMREV
jgi:hypothetical protein